MNQNEEYARITSLDPRPIMGRLGFAEVKQKSGVRYTYGDASFSVFKGNRGDYIFRRSQSTSCTDIFGLLRDVKGLNLGESRKLLRDCFGLPSPHSSPSAPKKASPTGAPRGATAPAPAAPAAHQTNAEHKDMFGNVIPPEQTEEQLDPREILRQIREESEPIGDRPLPWFIKKRGFSEFPPFFRDVTRLTNDKFANLVFLYHLPTADGGVELASRERIGDNHFKNYLKGTRAGVWIAAPKEVTIDHIVIGEAPLDCIASRQICDDGDATAYLAVRSGSEVACVDLVMQIIKKRGAEDIRVDLRTDNDPAGMRYAWKVGEGLALHKIVSRYQPPPDRHDDWTAALEAQAKA